MSRQAKSNKWATRTHGAAAAAAGAAMLIAGAAMADPSSPVVWTSKGAPTQATITGGPWTLEQSGAANGLKSSGYCDNSTPPKQVGNPGTERMSPYYFPIVYGEGSKLQGFFDWRPKDTDEAVAAASTIDGGQSWKFQSKVLELRTLCPTNLNAEPDGDSESTPNPNNSDNIDDDGQGHQYVITIGGKTILYTLNRSVNHIDFDQLVTHILTPTSTDPLAGAPALDDGPTDGNNPGDAPNSASEPSGTTGLINPDGILAAIPGTSPLKVIYEEKMLAADSIFPTTQQCAQSKKKGLWAAYYGANGGLSPNNDITHLRLATTTDGINFTDQGALQGLSDPTSVSVTGTRWLATAGTIIKLKDNRYGLLFSGGNCIDADSDSFHYIGYAESTDLINWTVINGLNNPIASVAPATVFVDAKGVPVGDGSGSSGGAAVTIPANPAVIGNTLGFFEGRVYGPSATQTGDRDITMFFAGYHTQKPKNGLGNYRNIGRVSLHASQPLLEVGPVLGGGGDHHGGDGD
jgi:hypothetical protein